MLDVSYGLPRLAVIQGKQVPRQRPFWRLNDCFRENETLSRWGAMSASRTNLPDADAAKPADALR